MPKFATKTVSEIKAREIVEQLLVDEVGQLDRLESDIQGTTYTGEFVSMLAKIQHVANGGNIGSIVKLLKGKDGHTEYEFRSKHLRVFAIQLPGKKLIIYGGIKRKADSSDNISIFRSLKKQYLESLKEKK